MNKRPPKRSSEPFTITEIGVRGFKCFRDEVSIEIRPITILAGANSSGKSSVMQPLLLLKQTLLDQADPGALKIDGPNVTFSNFDQLTWKGNGKNTNAEVQIHLKSNKHTEITEIFCYKSNKIDIKELSYQDKGYSNKLTQSMSEDEIISILKESSFKEIYKDSVFRKSIWKVVQMRCMLKIVVVGQGEDSYQQLVFPLIKDVRLSPFTQFEKSISSLIHLSGLRGNPERSYRKLGISTFFPGWFQEYAASMIYSLAERSNDTNSIQQLKNLKAGLYNLGLARDINASISKGDSTKIELNVSRREGILISDSDLVNIADVGLGVSQIVPLLVALVIAEPGQIVYVEQPEIHLHPNAQFELAMTLVAAANRGVRVIIETHSDILLLGIQYYVSNGTLDNNKVKLHWFKRDKSGASTIDSRDMAKDGSFGDWPEDFSSVRLEKQRAYINSVMK